MPIRTELTPINVTIDGTPFRVEITVLRPDASRWEDRKELNRAARTYVGGVPEHTEFPWDSIDDDDTKVIDRWARRQVREMRRFLAAAGFEGIGTWNRKAGCSCGCSPAFVNRERRDGSETFVTFERV